MSFFKKLFGGQDKKPKPDGDAGPMPTRTLNFQFSITPDNGHKFAQQFVDAVTAGLNEVEMDGNDLFLISKSLLKYLGNGKDVVLKGKFDRIQVWDAAKYEQYTQVNISNIQNLADDAAKYLDELEKGDNK